MKKKLIIVAVFLSCFSQVKAGNFNLESMTADDVLAADTQVKGIFDFIKPGKEEPMPSKEWTVMVFMNAKNDLSESSLFGLVGKWAEKDIDEMKKVGTTGKVNVVVEYGSKGKGSKRMLINKKSGGIGGLISSGEKVYGEYPNADMGDYKRVIEFVKWSKQTFPAKKYMLIIWNHGLGWIDPNMQEHTAGTGTSNKGIAFDDETKNYIRTKQLGDILRATGYIDVFAMNACLMQMAEVAYEVKGLTGLIVGSEETMLAQGFDYEKLLNFINANTNFSKEQISEFFINWYKQFYAQGMNVGPLTMPLDNVASTLSTLEPAALGELPQYLNYFADQVMKNNETEAVKAAIPSVIRFTSIADPAKDKKKLIAPYVDLYDFARIVGENAQNPNTRQAAQYLMDFIKNRLVIRSVGINRDAENNYDYTRVGGVAINMTMKIKEVPPQLAGVYETKYSDLSLSKDSMWDEFLTWTDTVWAR
ncbi:MAG: hypothetical protein Fur0012_05490 [Elusimicrobiota bacterium]